MTTRQPKKEEAVLERIDELLLSVETDLAELNQSRVARLLQSQPPPQPPAETKQQRETREYITAVKLAYWNHFTKFPLVLVGYNHYARNDTSMCIMYALTCGFFGFGALLDTLFIPLQQSQQPTRVWNLIRKCYSFAFVLIAMSFFLNAMPNAKPMQKVIMWLGSLFVCNEIGFFTILATYGAFLYSEVYVKNPLPEINPTVLFFLLLFSTWVLDVRIGDLVPFKPFTLKIIMYVSFAYYFHLLVFTPIFPQIGERVSLLTWRIVVFHVKKVFNVTPS